MGEESYKWLIQKNENRFDFLIILIFDYAL